MYKILKNRKIGENTKEMVVEAPLVARKTEPGQFVIVMIHEKSERIPLTVADFDREKGTITIVYLMVGKSTYELGQLKAGNTLAHFIGPLGNQSHVEGKEGTMVFVGGGVGIAAVYPIARKAKQLGNDVISIIGARTKDLLMWEEKMKEISDQLMVTTDDGSYGREGVVTEPLKDLLEEGKDIAKVITVGPTIMMKFVAKTTEPYGVKTIASLNPIMVDGTGMCGGCRVEVGGKSKFACVDGPEFDAHQVNFDILMKRLATYQEEEKIAMEAYKGK